MTPQETQRNVQFQQLMASTDAIAEVLVVSTSQLTAISNQLLQVRQHLQNLKACAPPIEPPQDNTQEAVTS